MGGFYRLSGIKQDDLRPNCLVRSYSGVFQQPPWTEGQAEAFVWQHVELGAKLGRNTSKAITYRGLGSQPHEAGK